MEIQEESLYIGVSLQKKVIIGRGDIACYAIPSSLKGNPSSKYRCHHCSTCQRCVLNMDHHCPWISNCVGYSNRKFFMLFLFYIILTLVFCLACEIPLAIEEWLAIFSNDKIIVPQTIIRAVALLVQLAFLIVIITFFKFHVELVLTNSSTLDNLERQRNPNAGPNIYDVGPYENFVQVFGTNAALWLIPIAPADYQKGNGVVWAKNQ